MLLKFEGEIYESYEEMLLAAMEDHPAKFSPIKIIENIDLKPNDVVEFLDDIGELERACDDNLEYEVVGE